MWVMIRYKLKPDQVQQNQELLGDYFAELETLAPDLRDAIFRLDDGVSFVQFVETGAEGPAALRKLPAFQRYRSTLDDRCEEPPVLTVLDKVGSYRLP